MLGYTGADTALVVAETYKGAGYEIYKYAFEGCSSLISVTIGESVTSIGRSAFYGCEKLAEVINRSELPITKGSRDYGYVAYYAKEVRTGE